jgi:activating signal cointegrator complex subunit 1
MQDEGRDLTLHATVLNTVYGKGGRRGGFGRGHSTKIDPSLLVVACEDFEWLEVVVDRVAICKMGAESVLNNEGEKVDEIYIVVKEVGIVSS